MIIFRGAIINNGEDANVLINLFASICMKLIISPSSALEIVPLGLEIKILLNIYFKRF